MAAVLVRRAHRTRGGGRWRWADGPSARADGRAGNAQFAAGSVRRSTSCVQIRVGEAMVQEQAPGAAMLGVEMLQGARDELRRAVDDQAAVAPVVELHVGDRRGEVPRGHRVVLDDHVARHTAQVKEQGDRHACPVLAGRAADHRRETSLGQQRPDDLGQLGRAGVEHVAVHPGQARVGRRVVGEERDAGVANERRAREGVGRDDQLLRPAEVDHLAEAKVHQRVVGVLGQPGQLVRAQDGAPAHPPVTGGRVTADVADVAGAVEGDVAGGLGRGHRVVGCRHRDKGIPGAPDWLSAACLVDASTA